LRELFEKQKGRRFLGTV